MCKPVRLMLLGDVMMGRGVDQILPHPGDPTLYEDSMDSALGYVELAERAGARISRPVPFDYVWGDAFEGLDAPRVRLINLETAITTDGRPWPDKPVLYRMHPRNVPAPHADLFPTVPLAALAGTVARPPAEEAPAAPPRANA
jgi:poly-gamma-glutamate synthesis protein (capsule biosynthesis protein)